VTGPGQTILEPGELVVSFRVPDPGPRSADAYLRTTPRSEMDIAIVGAGLKLCLDAKGVVIAARVVLGAVAPTALRVDDCADALIGTKLDEAALSEAARAASAAADPIDDKRGTIAYRRKVAGVLTRRAARIAYDRARERN
jgi:CO/xanthine dehydrogenase FAD-binding subunit